MVYFFQRGTGGPIKIGYTRSVTTRFKQIQQSCPEKLINLGCIDGGINKERELHHLFQDYRINGEWYTPNVTVVNHIMELITGIDLNLLPAGLAEHNGIDAVLCEIEKKLLGDALNKYDWNITETAKKIKIPFRSMRYRVAKYNLKKDNQ